MSGSKDSLQKKPPPVIIEPKSEQLSKFDSDKAKLKKNSLYNLVSF